MIDINGMAHIILTVSQYDKAKAFYSKLMIAMGLECVFDGSNMTYFVGGRIRSEFSPVRQNLRANASNKGVSGCITPVFAHVHALMSTGLMRCYGKWTPISSARPRKATGRQDTIMSCARIRTAFASKLIMSPERECLPMMRASTLEVIGSNNCLLPWGEGYPSLTIIVVIMPL
jgi:hypothetical protein